MTFSKASHNNNIITQQDKETCLCKCGHEWQQTISSDSSCGPWKPLVSTSIIHLQSSLVFKLKLLHYSFAVCWPHLIVLCCSGYNICWCQVIYETFVLLSSPLLRILFGKPIPLSMCLFAIPTLFCVQEIRCFTRAKHSHWYPARRREIGRYCGFHLPSQETDRRLQSVQRLWVFLHN